MSPARPIGPSMSPRRRDFGVADGWVPSAARSGVSWVSIASPEPNERHAPHAKAAKHAAVPRVASVAVTASPVRKPVASVGPPRQPVHRARAPSAFSSGANREDLLQRLLEENDGLYRELDEVHLTVTELRKRSRPGGGSADATSPSDGRPPPVSLPLSAGRGSTGDRGSTGSAHDSDEAATLRATLAELRSQAEAESDALLELQRKVAVEREQLEITRRQRREEEAAAPARGLSSKEAAGAAASHGRHEMDATDPAAAAEVTALRERLQAAQEDARRWRMEAGRLQEDVAAMDAARSAAEGAAYGGTYEERPREAEDSPMSRGGGSTARSVEGDDDVEGGEEEEEEEEAEEEEGEEEEGEEEGEEEEEEGEEEDGEEHDGEEEDGEEEGEEEEGEEEEDGEEEDGEEEEEAVEDKPVERN